jgi:hypothetical protein
LIRIKFLEDELEAEKQGQNVEGNLGDYILFRTYWKHTNIGNILSKSKLGLLQIIYIYNLLYAITENMWLNPDR